MTEINKDDALASLKLLAKYAVQEGQIGLTLAKKHGRKLIDKVQAKNTNLIDIKNENIDTEFYSNAQLVFHDLPTIKGRDFLQGGKAIGMTKPNQDGIAIIAIKVPDEDIALFKGLGLIDDKTFLRNNGYLTYAVATKNHLFRCEDEKVKDVVRTLYRTWDKDILSDKDLKLITESIKANQLQTVALA